MNFRPYSEYRKPNDERLPSIPDHWQDMPLKRGLDRMGSGGTPETNRPEYWTEKGGYPWVAIADMSERDAIVQTVKQVTDAGRSSKHLELWPAGTLLFSMYASLGHVAELKIAATTNQAILALLPNQEVHPAYLKRWLEHLRPSLRAEASSNTQDNLNAEKVRNLPFVLPTLREQTAIATFLNRETGKIDMLVEEQRRLIELLKEKREVVITHAVTKGLDPNAKMKKSGVQWLGDVPLHWEIGPLKRTWSVTDCKHITAEFVDNGIPVASIAEAQSWFVDLSAAKLTTSEYYEALIEGGRKPSAGDLIFTRNATVGAVAQVGEWHSPFAMGQDVCLLRPLERSHSTTFMQFSLMCLSVKQQLTLAMVGATFKRVNVEEIRSLILATPPAPEQVAIANYLIEQSRIFDELIDVAEHAVRLLTERRSALISAAVTGQIDVRAKLVAVGTDVPHLVVAEIVDRLSHMPTFGRVKFQKIVYLAEAEAGIAELEGVYLRAAAGPLDRELIDKLEAHLVKVGNITVEQPDGIGSPVRYQLRSKRATHGDELAAALGERYAKLNHIIDAVADLDTKGTEAIATLYAVWNDFLLDGKQPSDDAIVNAVLDEWHPEKKKKFRADELVTWLGWMRRQNLVPRGNGPRTTTGRLFA